MLSEAQLRALRLIAHHGKAVRVEPRTKANQWTWNIDGKPMSGLVDRLLHPIKALELSADKSTAALSQKGRAILREAA